ncbi:hypothetical protein NE235_14320 [Actinoallomurus spadix]|uniref:Integral membrane protein n=1 Tax=Actinoallomurus spadix TaxID=79912 RepID=A0ABN0WEJ6_9ACTN|nr:hypothetical protein [Actinoallomurus spadix]MCO5987279.1 hypothetical protein [Actinoallomurus spadix]
MTGRSGPDEPLIVQRYRALLRILPPSYRAAREEEMIAVFAESVGDTEDDALGRPDLAETASVVALATRVWFGGLGAPPRLFAFGQTVRLFALVGALAQAILAGAGALGLLDVVFFGSDDARDVLRTANAGSSRIDVAGHVAWNLLDLLWIPVYVTVVRGRRRAARLLAIPAALPLLIRLTVPFVWSWSTVAAVLVPVSVPALAIAVAFHRDAPPVRPVGGLAAVPAGAVALFAAGRLFPSLVPDPDGVYCWVALGAGAVCLVRSRSSADRALGHRSLAVALYAVLILAVRIHSAGAAGPLPYAGPVVYGQVAALLLLAGALPVVAVRTLRRAGPAPHRRPG